MRNFFIVIALFLFVSCSKKGEVSLPFAPSVPTAADVQNWLFSPQLLTIDTIIPCTNINKEPLFVALCSYPHDETRSEGTRQDLVLLSMAQKKAWMVLSETSILKLEVLDLGKDTISELVVEEGINVGGVHEGVRSLVRINPAQEFTTLYLNDFSFSDVPHDSTLEQKSLSWTFEENRLHEAVLEYQQKFDAQGKKSMVDTLQYLTTSIEFKVQQ